MIIKQEEKDILVSGNMEEVMFSMDSSSEHIVFDILRSKLYKNNIGAICREVASNSRDAQREIGDFTNPIEITIRDMSDSLFIEDGINIIFRDNGIGISPERVKNIYTKYGASTKRDSNVETGGFGLGAKTPFAYSDAFMVRTIVDNIEYLYSIYIDESKKGKMTLLEQKEVVNQNNMTEVIISVAQDDVDTFEYEVIRNTQFWNVRPTLIGFYNKYKNLQRTPKYFSQDHYEELYNNNSGVFESSINAIIDGIIYPVDMNIMKIYDNKFEEKICLYFNNGELGLSANRENLNYDKDTIKVIKERITGYIQRISDDAEKQIQSCPTLLDAIDKYNEFSRDDFFEFVFEHADKEPIYMMPDENGVMTEYSLDEKTYSTRGVNFTVVEWSRYNEKFSKNTYTNIFSCGKIKDVPIYKGDFKNVETNKRLNIGINRAIRKDPNTETICPKFIIVSPMTIDQVIYDANPDIADNIKGSMKVLETLGVKFTGDYYSVIPVKIPRAKIVDKAPKKTYKRINFKRVNYFNSDWSSFHLDYDPSTKNGFNVEAKDIVYHQVPDKWTVDKNLIKRLGDYSKLINKINANNTIFLIVEEKKMKYMGPFKDYMTFVLENADKITPYLKRKMLNNDLSQIDEIMSSLKFDTTKEIQDEIKEIAKLESLYFHASVEELSNKIGKFDITYLRDAIKSASKNYPLMDDHYFKHLSIKNKKLYIHQTNELIKLKEQKQTTNV